MTPSKTLRHARAAALAVLPSGQVVLVQPSDGAAGAARRWELPRGAIAQGETPEAAAIRVLKEQTGRADRDAAVSFLGSIHQEGALLADELPIFCVFLRRETPSGEPDSAESAPREAGSFSWERVRELTLSGEIKDAAALSAFTLFHERHGSGQRPKSYELSASFFLRDLRGDYFNAWYPEALRLLGDLGLDLELGAEEPLCITASGRAALTDDQIEQVRLCLIDIGKHCVGRLWATQIINGREAIDDLADPERALS